LTDKTKKSVFIVAIVSLIVFLSLKNISPFSNLQSSFTLFFISGFLGFFASVLPGLSGSIVLLIIGTYPLILKAVTEKQVDYLMVFLIGGVIGFSCAFYLIRFFLKNKKNLFFCITLGLIIGSLPEMISLKKEHILSINTLIINISIFSLIGVALFILVENLFFWKKIKKLYSIL
ncbi:MAG: DUF368 domain-containing protein, partial [Bdellovibrionaceae bacterium]|nr:DUF368 domain-containing protein [Pseudobdellovibrionaceae bacterium]